MTKAYDSKCYELAEHFSETADPLTKAELDALAGDVQSAVESFFNWRESQRERASEDGETFRGGEEIGRATCRERV